MYKLYLNIVLVYLFCQNVIILNGLKDALTPHDVPPYFSAGRQKFKPIINVLPQ